MGCPNRRRVLGMGLAASSAALLAACGRKGPKMQAVPAGATVLALGDSLTFGYGATPETSYPTVLARLTGWNVVNAGVTGETAAQILERTPALLQEYKPALVLVCAGGNDFLQKKPEADTRATIRAICQQCKDAGAQVLLVAVPALNIMSAVTSSLADHTLYEGVATEMQVPLHAKGWSRVLGDSSMRSDQVHANAKGYERFANELRETLQDVGLLK